MPRQSTPISIAEQLELRPGQSLGLLQALHILTRDGKINQDSRRKLKQVNHLLQFIEPHIVALQALTADDRVLQVVDHGAGKSYLGFLLYDLFFKNTAQAVAVHSIETRPELVAQARKLAGELGFTGMHFHQLNTAEACASPEFPERVDIVTALHACNTATDDALSFGLAKRAERIIVVPCCQAEVAATLRQAKNKTSALSATEAGSSPLGGNALQALCELWRRPLHTREFGSQLTNVLRCLRLEASGYQVTVTELVGWEHSMKNELLIATKTNQKNTRSATRLNELLKTFGLEQLYDRFSVI